MGHVLKLGSGSAHEIALLLAESVRQATVATATQNAAGAVVVRNAEITFARAGLASCLANNGGQGQETFISALKSLGTGGV
jgi:hypothetical protein